ncbi:hypothetical protein ILUMI_27441 [Ignelater luminosus]|uniref:Uncharacterized protein n=1 Tax=Ignelater luminosus TaxID=2038154 RepID=A0A8K0C7X6_IGNLU|nr:hypothetical protein ILUMI_27441 [Ignelater luminosus]
MDFSENCNCKYGTEVQSAHFGSSKPQISLHTVIIYYKDHEDSSLKTMPCCSIANDIQHDPVAICVHLEPLMGEVKTLMPTIRYHFSERRHGKGAPDGIGGCLKRTADTLIGQGKDIHNFETFVNELNKNIRKIKIHAIDTTIISEIDKILPEDLATFKGTMKIHEVAWTNEKPSILQTRELSCLQCSPGESCLHYGLVGSEFGSFRSDISSIKGVALQLLENELNISTESDLIDKTKIEAISV